MKDSCHTHTYINTYVKRSACRADTVQCVAVCWRSVLTTHCNTLQHTARHCKTLQHTATACRADTVARVLCSVLSTHCNTLQLQHTAYGAPRLLLEFLWQSPTLVGLFCKKRRQMLESLPIVVTLYVHAAFTRVCCSVLQSKADCCSAI